MRLPLLALLVASSAACAHAKKEAAPVASVPAAPAPVVSTAPAAPPPAPSCRGDAECRDGSLCLDGRCAAIDAATTACRGLSAYFAYDQSTIGDADRAGLQRASRCLRALDGAKLRIEGNCDERGTVAYNLALGHRRAAAARQYLVDLGSAPSRISTVSYGKERPRCTEHAEACWATNRRADLVEER